MIYINHSNMGLMYETYYHRTNYGELCGTLHYQPLIIFLSTLILAKEIGLSITEHKSVHKYVKPVCFGSVLLFKMS